MKATATTLAPALFFSVHAASAQNRSAELDKAYEEARAAYNALQAAEARRDQGVESLPGERQGSAAGGSQRYEAAMKRWNDLK